MRSKAGSRLPERAARGLGDDEDLLAGAAQVERGLLHADVGLGAAQDGLLAAGDRGLLEAAIGPGGEELFADVVRAGGRRAHHLDGAADLLGEVLGDHHRHADARSATRQTTRRPRPPRRCRG